MRKWVLVIVFSLIASSSFAADGKFLRSGGNSIPGRYIVQLTPDTAVRATVNELALGHAARPLHVYEHALRGAAFEMNEHQAQAMSRHPKVALVEEDFEVWPVGTQTNPPSWGLDRVDQRNLPVDSSYTWDFDGTGVNVYVIDTGIRASHTDFGGRVSHGADFIGDGQNGNDCRGHGTHVAGTIGGSSFGVAKNVHLVRVRVFGCSGSSPGSTLIAGIDWVTAHHVKPAVANVSFIAGGSVSLDAAVNNSVDAGVFYAVAAGNSNLDACNFSPARAANAFTVGATTQSDTGAWFTNYGSCLEIFAPGEGVTSAWHTSDTAIYTDSGTSMAAPHVAGAAAIILDADPSLPPAQVAAVITSRATNGVLTNVGLGSPNRLLSTRGTPPVARFRFTCSGLTCSFDATGSTDDGGIVSFSWSFGDSTTGGGATEVHAYPQTGAFTATLTVTDADGLQSSTSRKISAVSEPPMPAENFFSVPPCRIADTRTTTPLSSNVQRTFQVTGLCGIPATARAVSFNATVVAPTGAGHLVFLPGNQTSGPFPHATINFAPADSPRSNNGIARLATNSAGTIRVHPLVAATPGEVHLIVDVYGYFSEDTAPAPGAQGPFGFQSVTPCRIADTRTTGTPIAVNTTRNFTVQGVCGVPSGAAAAVLNPTIIAPTAAGHAPLFQAGAFPPVATIHFNAGVVLANGASIRLAPITPDVALSYFSPIGGSSTHAMIDVYGYFKSQAPLKFRPITACRAVDTRSMDQGGPALKAPDLRNFQIRGNCGVPTTARAAAVNITVIGSSGPGHLTVYASGGPAPAASYLNFNPAQGALGNGGVVALSTLAEDLAIQSANSTHVIVDVFGYFQ